MGMENPKSRILSDAEFIKGGAEVLPDGEIRLTEKQIEDLQDRLKRAERTIEVLEGDQFQQDLVVLKAEGAALDREMVELHEVVESLRTSEYLIALHTQHTATADRDMAHYEEKKERLHELDLLLKDFFRKVGKFADDYRIHPTGGEYFDFERSRGAEIARKIGDHFKSLDELFEALMQARDAKLYRAYRDKREITGTM